VKRGGIPLFMWRMDLENYWKLENLLLQQEE